MKETLPVVDLLLVYIQMFWNQKSTLNNRYLIKTYINSLINTLDLPLNEYAYDKKLFLNEFLYMQLYVLFSTLLRKKAKSLKNLDEVGVEASKIYREIYEIFSEVFKEKYIINNDYRDFEYIFSEYKKYYKEMSKLETKKHDMDFYTLTYFCERVVGKGDFNDPSYIAKYTATQNLCIKLYNEKKKLLIR